MHYTSTLLFLSALISPTLSFIPDPTVQLDYGSFRGKYNTAYNITHFNRIPFAAPPTGQNRFRAPQPPLPLTNGIYDSTKAFPGCPQRKENGSEDCLYLGLYSRPWTSPAPKRPVVVFFYGGAFIQGAARIGMPPSGYATLNVSAENDFILVFPNYRVNAFGFLPGRRMKESQTSDLNPGLLDQQFALQWVRKHIAHFGGDPEQVAIWGQSAGGGSVLGQVMANGGKTEPKLFNKALASSPFWPKTYRYDSPEAEAIYDQMVKLTGCGSAQDSLQCLKGVDVQKIRDASLVVSDSHKYTTSSYTWAPVIDGTFLREPLSEAAKHGRINGDVVFGMYNSHEGENFIPGGLSTASNPKGFNSSMAGLEFWLRGFLPGFSKTLLGQVLELYPAKGEAEAMTYNATYTRAGLIFRDVVLTCPAYWAAKGAKKNGWLGEYTISPARHASDVGYWNTVNQLQKTQPDLYRKFVGVFGRFLQSGDPNLGASAADSARVPEIGSGKELLITSSGLSESSLTRLEKRCAFWQANGAQIPV